MSAANPELHRTIGSTIAAKLTDAGDPALTPEIVRQLTRLGVFVPQAFLKLTGSLTAAHLLAQLVFVDGLDDTKKRGGWSYLTREEMKKKFFISRREQETARKILKGRECIQEKLMGLPGKVHFKVNWRGLMQRLSQLAQNEPTSWPGPGQVHGRHETGKIADSEPTAWLKTGQHFPESTTESTAEKSRDPKVRRNGDHRPNLEGSGDDFHKRLLKFKAGLLRRSKGPVGQLDRAADFIIERIEAGGYRPQSQAYFDKAVEEFFESASDRELLKRSLARNPIERDARRRGHNEKQGALF